MSILGYDDKLLLAANGLTGHSAALDHLYVILATWPVYLIPVILLYIWVFFPVFRLNAIRAFGSGLIAWVGFNTVIGWIWYRPRPALKMVGVHELLLHQPDKSFPSDHAAFGMAIAATFILSGQKRLGWFLVFWTLLFSIARVIVAVHYPLDILGGYVVGILTALLINYFGKQVNQYIGQPIILLLRKFRLA